MNWQLSNHVLHLNLETTECFGLLQHRANHGILQIGRIPLFAQDALDQHTHARTRRVAAPPIHRSAAFKDGLINAVRG